MSVKRKYKDLRYWKASTNGAKTIGARVKNSDSHKKRKACDYAGENEY